MTDGDEREAPIRALIFDMDGLLVDSEPLAEHAMAAMLRRYDRELQPEMMGRTMGLRLPEAMAVIADGYQIDRPVDELVNTYDGMRLEAVRQGVPLMTGARQLVDFARAAGLKLALATSSKRSHAEVVLAGVGLAGLFDVESTGDDVERSKPAPDIFLLAARRLGVAPESCVVLEDAPPGVAAAAAAGMRCLCVPNEKTRAMSFPVAPTATLPDLAAAIPWLRERGVGEALPTGVAAETKL